MTLNPLPPNFCSSFGVKNAANNSWVLLYGFEIKLQYLKNVRKKVIILSISNRLEDLIFALFPFLDRYTWMFSYANEICKWKENLLSKSWKNEFGDRSNLETGQKWDKIF